VPRRIIHGLNINHEIEFFRVRLEELKVVKKKAIKKLNSIILKNEFNLNEQDAVDVYIVCESNYTAHGDAKPLHLVDKLRSGFMGAYHSKIVHVPLYKFPPEGRENGWFIDMYLRTYMGIHGLKRVHGVRSDDLFVLLDADEIPTREVLMFLKLYDGYPEPVRLAMRWSVFGFFWKRKRGKQTGSIFNWILDVVKEDDNNAEDLLEVTAVNHHDC
jgi:beta-1,4-mannosyl-glycoprotein beta-1,4-N-acetylglucosaminyltransferase